MLIRSNTTFDAKYAFSSVFSALDCDKNGYISEGDYQNIRAKLGPVLAAENETEINTIFKGLQEKYGINNTAGGIDRDLFRRIVSNEQFQFNQATNNSNETPNNIAKRISLIDGLSPLRIPADKSGISSNAITPICRSGSFQAVKDSRETTSTSLYIDSRPFIADTLQHQYQYSSSRSGSISGPATGNIPIAAAAAAAGLVISPPRSPSVFLEGKFSFTNLSAAAKEAIATEANRSGKNSPRTLNNSKSTNNSNSKLKSSPPILTTTIFITPPQ